jgi:beta-glucanase (GH16 family)
MNSGSIGRRASAGALFALLALVLPALTITTTPASAAAKASSPCGSTVLKPDGTAWKCTFADDFGGRGLDGTKWVAQETAISGVHSGPECLVNSSNNIAVAKGTLRLTVRKETAPFTCHSPYGDYTTQYTSGSVSTWGRFSQAFGRWEFRAKFPAATVAGLQSALWLYPQTQTYGAWPASGEIDVGEAYSVYPDRVIPYVHYYTATSDPTVTNWSCKVSNLGTFHTYVAEWTRTGLTIKYDGATCLVHTWDPADPLVAPAPFDKPFVTYLTQVLGTGTNAFNASTTPLPATMEVDWVRIWS